jgi:magnesium chelatase subunit I
LATPDVTIADLIGEIDPIKVAEGRYLSDEFVIHYGLIPRTNRGIFSINELPDLSEKIQVGLFNLMEERDIQIRGFKIQLPLDVYIVASANPEDYTNRGRIITPLKDRYGSQIRTHYPLSLNDEVSIIEQERNTFEEDGYVTTIPHFMKEIIAEITRYARNHPEVNQRSGVSVRMSINNFENLLSNALKRAIRLREKEVVPRISDLYSIIPSSIGKIETIGIEEKREDPIITEIIKKAVLTVFNRIFTPENFDTFLKKFSDGQNIEVSEATPSSEYLKKVAEFGGLSKVLSQQQANSSLAMTASLLEFILEGLYLNRRLSKEEVGGRAFYYK